MEGKGGDIWKYGRMIVRVNGRGILMAYYNNLGMETVCLICFG